MFIRIEGQTFSDCKRSAGHTFFLTWYLPRKVCRRRSPHDDYIQLLLIHAGYVDYARSGIRRLQMVRSRPSTSEYNSKPIIMRKVFLSCFICVLLLLFFSSSALFCCVSLICFFSPVFGSYRVWYGNSAYILLTPGSWATFDVIFWVRQSMHPVNPVFWHKFARPPSMQSSAWCCSFCYGYGILFIATLQR